MSRHRADRDRRAGTICTAIAVAGPALPGLAVDVRGACPARVAKG